MSYRCSACGTKVPPGSPQRRHVTRYGPQAPAGLRGQIAREFSVCEECDFRLAHGATLAQLAAEGQSKRDAEARGKQSARDRKKQAAAGKPAAPITKHLPSLVGQAVPLRGREVKAAPKKEKP